MRPMEEMTAERAAEACAGLTLDSAEWQEARDAVAWEGLWPEVDGDGQLTGKVVGSEDGYLKVDGEAMIAEEVARRAGWRIDTANGTATPSAPVAVEVACADETINLRGGVCDFAGLDHPATGEACAAYHTAALDSLDRDPRARRLRADRPRGPRMLHSQWCGAKFDYSAGAIGTMARDLTDEERAAIDAAHEAGLAAARTVIEEDDAASAAADAGGE